MDISPTTWMVLPAIGGVIGYVTNWLAVKMIFRPFEPWNVLGLRIQGLMPRRQADMAKSIGNVVGDHLLHHRDIAQGLASLDLESLFRELMAHGLAPKLAELKALPLIGGFLTDDRIDDLRNSIVRSLLANKEAILDKIEDALERGLDVRTVVAEKVAAFPVQKLETLVLSVAARELRAIEVIGGALGVAIGVCQVLLLRWTG